MIPNTADRAMAHADEQTRQGIESLTYENLVRYANSHPCSVQRRLEELDQEWDLDRVLSVSGPALTLAGLGMGLRGHRAWLLLALGSAAGMLTYGLFGWHPALGLARRLNIRTTHEIARERYALKALRGDFQNLDAAVTPDDRDQMARMEGEGGGSHGATGPDAGETVVVEEVIQAVIR